MVLLINIAGTLIMIFNLFTIWKIYRTDIYQKWWKYLLPLFVNFPTFIASIDTGLSWKFLAFQLLGSHIMIGFQSHIAIAALPIGSLYIWWKLEYWKVSKEFSQI